MSKQLFTSIFGISNTKRPMLKHILIFIISTLIITAILFFLLRPQPPQFTSNLDPVSSDTKVAIDAPQEQSHANSSSLSNKGAIGSQPTNTLTELTPTETPRPKDSSLETITTAIEEVNNKLATLETNMNMVSDRINAIEVSNHQLVEEVHIIQREVEKTKNLAGVRKLRHPMNKQPSKSPVPPPVVLSLDNWGGQPSFVLQEGNDLRFVESVGANQATSESDKVISK